MDNRRITPMLEGGILAAISTLMIMAVYIPFLGIVAKLLCPVPVVLLGVRHGLRPVVLTLSVVTVIEAMVISPIYAFLILPGFVLVSIALIYAFRRKYSAAKTLCCTSAASLLAQLMTLAAIFFFMGIDLMGDGVNKMVDDMLAFYRSSDVSVETLQKMELAFTQFVSMTKVLLPVSILVFSVITAYLNFITAGIFLRRINAVEIPVFPPFRLWKFPREVVYFYVVSLLGLYWGNAYQSEMLTNVSTNLWMIMTLITLLQGASLLAWFAYKYNLSKTVQGIILFLILINGALAQILSMAGVFDILFDYRSRFGGR